MSKDLNKKELTSEKLDKVAGGIGLASLPLEHFPQNRKIIGLGEDVTFKGKK